MYVSERAFRDTFFTKRLFSSCDPQTHEIVNIFDDDRTSTRDECIQSKMSQHFHDMEAVFGFAVLHDTLKSRDVLEAICGLRFLRLKVQQPQRAQRFFIFALLSQLLSEVK